MLSQTSVLSISVSDSPSGASQITSGKQEGTMDRSLGLASNHDRPTSTQTEGGNA